MLCRTIFVFLIGLVLVKLVKMEHMEVKFQIYLNKTGNGKVLACDHNLDNITKQKKMYTVLEGEDLTLITSYKSFINNIVCLSYSNNNTFDFYVSPTKNVSRVKVLKSMGDVWDCMVLTHRDNPTIKPVVIIGKSTFTAAYCYIQLHVRQKNAPQTILVNNMVLEPVRTNMSVQDIDLTAEYKYADGDIVDVNCVNLEYSKNKAQLKMTYHADSLSSQGSGLGFRARLNSRYDNTDIICKLELPNNEFGPKDFTKVSVKFIMQPKFYNTMNMRINGILIRPKKKSPINSYYEIEYKYSIGEQLELVCETDQHDVKLMVVDHLLDKSEFSSYQSTNVTDKKVVVLFKSAHNNETILRCIALTKTGGYIEETIEIKFTPKFKTNDRCQFHIDLPVNNTVMELYEFNKLKIILYEFEDGDKLTINCSGTCTGGPLPYVHFKDSDKLEKSSVSKVLNLNRQQDNTVQTCYLKDQAEKERNPAKDYVLEEIRVTFRHKVLTTTTTTTSTTTTSTTEAPISSTPLTNNTVLPYQPANKDPQMERWIMGLLGGIACILIICVSTIIFKLRKRNHSQGGPHDRNYENLPTPSEAPISEYLVQWESDNYAVPVDQKREDTDIYSVPECPLYSSAIPKHARKKTKNTESTYAILNIGTSNTRPRNNLKVLEDSNYAEVRNLEESYAKIVPKSERKKQDVDPYSYVTNENPYAYPENVCPEPMYCDPATVQRSEYANAINNSPYANIPRKECVEPTYCEPSNK